MSGLDLLSPHCPTISQARGNAKSGTYVVSVGRITGVDVTGFTRVQLIFTLFRAGQTLERLEGRGDAAAGGTAGRTLGGLFTLFRFLFRFLGGGLATATGLANGFASTLGPTGPGFEFRSGLEGAGVEGGVNGLDFTSGQVAQVPRGTGGGLLGDDIGAEGDEENGEVEEFHFLIFQAPKGQGM